MTDVSYSRVMVMSVYCSIILLFFLLCCEHSVLLFFNYSGQGLSFMERLVQLSGALDYCIIMYSLVDCVECREQCG